MEKFHSCFIATQRINVTKFRNKPTLKKTIPIDIKGANLETSREKVLLYERETQPETVCVHVCVISAHTDTFIGY